MKKMYFENHRKSDRQCGFTLIELLVVFAIVLALAGLLLPVLSRSKAKARDVQCLSQLKQLGIATRLYAEDSGGVLPSAELLPSNPTDPQHPLPRICDLLGRYVGNRASTNASAIVFRCPRDNDWFYEVEGSSYQWNTLLNGRRIDLGEKFNGHFGLVSNGVPVWQTNVNFTTPVESTPMLLDYDDFHPRPPQSGKNVVYMDGHAAVFDK